MVTELARDIFSNLRPHFLFISVSLSYLIDGNPGKNRHRGFPQGSCSLDFVLLNTVHEGGGGGCVCTCESGREGQEVRGREGQAQGENVYHHLSIFSL